MKTWLFKSIAICLLAIGITGCGQKQNAPARASQDTQPSDQGNGAAPGAPHMDASVSPIADPSSPFYGSEKFNSPDHAFTVMFPARPEEKQKSEQSAQGEIQVQVFASQDSEAREGYSVACYDFPPINEDTKMFLARLEQIIITEQGATVTSYKPMQAGNNTATEFGFAAGGKANYSGKCRLILVGQRVYALMADYLTAGTPPVDADAFFDSFSLQQN